MSYKIREEKITFDFTNKIVNVPLTKFYIFKRPKMRHNVYFDMHNSHSPHKIYTGFITIDKDWFTLDWKIKKKLQGLLHDYFSKDYLLSHFRETLNKV